MKKIPLIMLLTLSVCLTLGMAIAVDYPLTVTDSAETVTIEAPVEKIVVLNSDAADAVSILGDVEKIVGRWTSPIRPTTSPSSLAAGRRWVPGRSSTTRR